MVEEIREYKRGCYRSGQAGAKEAQLVNKASNTAWLADALRGLWGRGWTPLSSPEEPRSRRPVIARPSLIFLLDAWVLS